MGFDIDYAGYLRKYSGNTSGTLEIPSETRYIGSGAFSDTDIRSIDLSTAWVLSEIMNDAFNGCSHLKYIEMNDGITRIGSQAFYACSALETIKFPSDIEEIETRAFALCYKLNNIEIPYGIRSIGSEAFLST